MIEIKSVSCDLATTRRQSRSRVKESELGSLETLEAVPDSEAPLHKNSWSLIWESTGAPGLQAICVYYIYIYVYIYIYMYLWVESGLTVYFSHDLWARIGFSCFLRSLIVVKMVRSRKQMSTRRTGAPCRAFYPSRRSIFDNHWGPREQDPQDPAVVDGNDPPVSYRSSLTSSRWR